MSIQLLVTTLFLILAAVGGFSTAALQPAVAPLKLAQLDMVVVEQIP